MHFEFIFTVLILVIVSLILAMTDLAVSGIVSLISAVSFKTVFCWGLLSLAVAPAFVLYGAIIERNNFQVKKVEISFDTLPEAFDGYKIIHISDIHSRSFEGREAELEKAVTIMNSLDADALAFTGDIISLSASELDSTKGILSRLKTRDGVFSVLGNHDYGVYANPAGKGIIDTACVKQVLETEQEMGWNTLTDSSVVIRRGKGESSSEGKGEIAGHSSCIAIVGVQNTTPSPHFNSQGDLQKASNGTDGLFRILLSHDPMHWEAEVTGKDYPLTLSGHTHAMQFSLFGWSPSKYMFKHYQGLYESGDCRQRLYVNIGLGETIFPARIGARPEITLITLRRQ